MKVLQVNNVYKKGSTGKITFDIHKGLLNQLFVMAEVRLLTKKEFIKHVLSGMQS